MVTAFTDFLARRIALSTEPTSRETPTQHEKPDRRQKKNWTGRTSQLKKHPISIVEYRDQTQDPRSTRCDEKGVYASIHTYARVYRSPRTEHVTGA